MVQTVGIFHLYIRARGVARISGRGCLKIYPLLRLPLMRVRVHEWVGWIALAHAKHCCTNELVGRGGALRSRCLLPTAIHGILRPAQRGVLEPPEPTPGYATESVGRRSLCTGMSKVKSHVIRVQNGF